MMCVVAFNVFIAYPAEPCCAVHSKYSRKREHQCRDDAVYGETETKPFTQNTYLTHYRDIYHRCARVSHKRAARLENMSRDFMVVFLHVFK